MKKKNIVDGKNRENAKLETESLDKILSSGSSNPFKCVKLEDFNEKLSDMNLIDMQSLAVKVGLLPVHDRKLMKERLVKEFKKKISKINGGVTSHVDYKTIKAKEKISPELQEILKEFR